MRMPLLESVNVVLSGDDVIGPTLTASKLVNGGPGHLSLPITNEGVNVVTERVKVLLLLGSVHTRQLKGKLAHGLLISRRFCRKITHTRLRVLEAKVREFYV